MSVHGDASQSLISRSLFTLLPRGEGYSYFLKNAFTPLPLRERVAEGRVRGINWDTLIRRYRGTFSYGEKGN